MNKNLKLLSKTVFFVLITFKIASAQEAAYPYEIEQFPFIRYDDNTIDFYNDSSSFERLFSKFDSLNFYGRGQINIVHLGGSHLQADIYSHHLRQRLQTFMPGNNGGRGLLFPYRIASTNNPWNYKVKYQGNWDYSKNTKRRLDGPLGLLGIKVVTSDTTSIIRLSPNRSSNVEYEFNKVRVYHNIEPASFKPVIDAGVEVEEVFTNGELGYTDFLLCGYSDTLNLSFKKSDSIQQSFELYGIQLMTDDPGIIYHAVGVNGASLPSFNSCELFVKQLEAVAPDLVVISIGTNDGNTRYFKPDVYRQNYDILIHRIKKAAPHAAILLTVPNDSYLFSKYLNKNTAKIEEEIIHLAKEHGGGVWDFYKIMGGLNSIYVWYKEGLARYDKIHFTREGYELKGDLLFNALLKAYDNHLEILISEKSKKHKAGQTYEAGPAQHSNKSSENLELVNDASYDFLKRFWNNGGMK